MTKPKTTKPEPDLSAFHAATGYVNRGCPVGRALAGTVLDDQQKCNLQAALEAVDISAAAVFVVLKAQDVNMSKESIRKHKRGLCSCPTA